MIKSRLGKSIDTEEVKRLNAEAKDWMAKCPRCGVSLSGTLEELKGHRCNIGDESKSNSGNPKAG